MVTHFYTASTLDGFIATEEDSLDWLFAQDFDLDAPMAYPTFIERIGSLVMGAATYEWLLRNQESWGYPQPTWVFTHHSVPVPDGADVRIVQGRPGEVFDAIAESAGGLDVWVVGGGDLAGQFVEDGLLDEIWVQIAPILLGRGKPLFTRRVQLALVEVVRNRDFVSTRYRVGDRDPGPIA